MKHLRIGFLFGIFCLYLGTSFAEEKVLWGFHYGGNPVAFEVTTSAVPLLDQSFKLNSIGKQLAADKEFQQALTYYQQALDLRIKAVGEDHPFSANIMDNMGTAFWGLGDFAKAEKYYKRAFDIQNRHVQPDNPDYQRAARHLYKLYIELGKTKEAAEFKKKVNLLDY